MGVHGGEEEGAPNPQELQVEAPSREGAAPDTEKEWNRLMRALEGCFKELEFYHSFIPLTMKH